jgi:ribosomal protein S8
MTKYFLIFLSAFMVALTTMLQAESVDNRDIAVTLEVYPTEIRFGDVFFSSVTIENNSKYQFVSEFSHLTGVFPHVGVLTNSESADQVLYKWFSFFAFESTENGIQRLTRIPPKRLTIETNTLAETGLTMFYLPLFAPPGNDTASELQDVIAKGKNKFTFERTASLRLYRGSKSGVDDLQYGYHRDLNSREYKISTSELLKTSVIVSPRKTETLDMLRAWYRELPTGGYNSELGTPLFIDYSYAQNSPNLIPVEYDISGRVVKPTLNDGEGLYLLRRKSYTKFKQFVESLRTRTPELLQRIKRTKELETELLKLPDSELSQNMKEFIQLRGYLVDLRFAENEKDEENTFNKFVTFIEKSKDKKLWIRFVDEIALKSILDNEYFSNEKVESYRKRLNEKFAKPETMEGQK